MKCNNSKMLMMKYMDNALSCSEAEILNEHVYNCELCKSDFILYDSILDELSSSAIIYEAPGGFEDQVMQKVYDLDIEFSLIREPENILNAILGVCAVLFGSGILLYIYQDNVFNWVLENQYVGEYVKTLVPSISVISEYFDNIYSLFSQLTFIAFELLFISRYIVLGVLFVLILIQFVIYNKSNNKVES